MKKSSKQWGTQIRSDMDKNIEYCKQKYRRVGRYIDEVIGVSRYE